MNKIWRYAALILILFMLPYLLYWFRLYESSHAASSFASSLSVKQSSDEIEALALRSGGERISHARQASYIYTYRFSYGWIPYTPCDGGVDVTVITSAGHFVDSGINQGKICM